MKTVALCVLMFGAGFMFDRGLASVGAVQRQAVNADDTVVTGIGGVFFKARDPEELRAWYRRHLGIDAGPQGFNFFWRADSNSTEFGRTVWSIFPEETTYFGDPGQDLMINYRVRNLDDVLTNLRAQGVQQVGTVEEYWYGRFAWIVDGEGNRVELWEPAILSREEYELRMKAEDRSR